MRERERLGGRKLQDLLGIWVKIKQASFFFLLQILETQTNGPWSQAYRIIFVCFVIYCNISFLRTCSVWMQSAASHRLEVAPTSQTGGGGADPGRMIPIGLQFPITADEFLLMSSFHLVRSRLWHPVIQSFFFCFFYICTQHAHTRFIHKWPSSNICHPWMSIHPYSISCAV